LEESYRRQLRLQPGRARGVRFCRDDASRHRACVPRCQPTTPRQRTWKR
jgi:hypothetical protein